MQGEFPPLCLAYRTRVRPTLQSLRILPMGAGDPVHADLPVRIRSRPHLSHQLKIHSLLVQYIYSLYPANPFTNWLNTNRAASMEEQRHATSVFLSAKPKPQAIVDVVAIDPEPVKCRKHYGFSIHERLNPETHGRIDATKPGMHRSVDKWDNQEYQHGLTHWQMAKVLFQSLPCISTWHNRVEGSESQADPGWSSGI